MALNGLFQAGDRVQLANSKNRHFTVILKEGGRFFTHRDTILHDDLIGAKEGIVVTSGEGTVYLAMRHLLVDYVLSIPRSTAVIHPKDAIQIIVEGDIFPSVRVSEAGVGSDALSPDLLRAIGADRRLISYGIHKDHIEHAERNVVDFVGHKPGNWDLRPGDLNEASVESFSGPVDQVILDMPIPWKYLDTVSKALQPGGVLAVYAATISQLMKITEGTRAQKYFTEPHAWESLVRDWNVQDLSVCPARRMQAHTTFLTRIRRLADGTVPPRPQRRDQKRLQNRRFTLGGVAIVKCDAIHGLNRSSNNDIWPYG